SDLTKKGEAHFFYRFLSSGLSNMPYWTQIVERIIKKLAEDFTNNVFFKNIPAVMTKALVIGLASSTPRKREVLSLLNKVSKTILRHTKILLTDNRFTKTRDECV